MKHVPSILAIWLASLALAARAEPLMFSGPTMGTAYHVRFVVGESAVDLPQLKKYVESLLADVDRHMSTYRDDSELSRFNRASAGEWFEPVQSRPLPLFKHRVFCSWSFRLAATPVHHRSMSRARARAGRRATTGYSSKSVPQGLPWRLRGCPNAEPPGQ